jgi:hypothetical protein
MTTKYIKLPKVQLTPKELAEKISEIKERTGLDFTFDNMGPSISDAFTSKKKNGPIDSKRRKRKLCIQLSPFEWQLSFPGSRSEYGGIVCY